MSRDVHWSDRAKADLRGVISYIAKRNKIAAAEFNKYVREITANLGLMPIGRPGELPGTFERILTRYPSYMIIYTMDAKTLYITRFFHAAQKSKH